MKPHPSSWTRLVAAARLAVFDEPRDAAAPHGFATRVAALGMARMEPTFLTLFARVCPRALCVCGLLMIFGVAFNFGPVLNAVEADAVAVSDPVAEWLEAAS